VDDGAGKHRVLEHPILGRQPEQQVVEITVDGQTICAIEGEPVLAALVAHGIRRCRTTTHTGESRWFFCGNGRCTDCMMIVDGMPNVRTCVVRVAAGMRVETQHGAGYWAAGVEGG
jgi:predicted molibdopterin-dependent oxidoreductase YjgC